MKGLSNNQKTTLLSPEEERTLLAKAKAGDKEARSVLCERNLRLVKTLARKYAQEGISCEDLEQEGTIALLEAIDNFDPEIEGRLSTYATILIHHRMADYLAGNRYAVRVPYGTNTKLRKLKKAKEEFYKANGKEASFEELSQIVKTPLTKVRTMERLLSPTLSLDAPDEDGHALLDSLADPNAFGNENNNAKELYDTLSLLPKRMRQILALRYGLNGESPQTLSEIGKELNLSHARVGQLEKEALRRMASRMM